MKKLLLSATLVAGMMVSGGQDAGAVSINIGNGTYTFTETTTQVASGVKYTYYKCSSRGTYGTHVYVTEVDLTNPNVRVEYLTANGTMGGSTKSLANIASGNTRTGHKVVAGANANFWITSEQPWKSQLQYYPHGTAISNGTYYSINPRDGMDAHMGGPTTTGSIGIGTNGRAYIKRFFFHNCIYNPEVNHYLDIRDINRVVTEGSANIYTPGYGRDKAFKPVNLTSSNTWTIAGGTCTEIYCTLAPGEKLEGGGDTKYIIKEVRTNAGTGTLGNYDLAIVGRDISGAPYATVMAQNYKVGQTITLQQRFVRPDYQIKDWENSAQQPQIIPVPYENATSGNCVTMEGGTVLTAEINAQSGYNGNVYARTLYATNDDGSKFWILVCGNKTSTYYGMTTSQMTYFAKALGATYASQVDCGGSSQMWVSGKGQVNKSTDSGDVRNVHSGMFVVVDDTGGGAPATPSLTTSATATNFGTVAVGGAANKQFSVSGSNLTGAINMTISGANANQFVVTPSSISQSAGSGTITVKYAPTTAGTHSATLTIATSGASSINVSLSGTAEEGQVTVSGVYPDEAEAYGVTASSSYTLEREYQDHPISQLAGKTIKRVIARGDILYILAHDTNNYPTIVVFNHTTKQVVRTLGVENAVIPGVDNTVGISDIAMTSDGYLVGTHYATQAFQQTGYGVTYKWDSRDADGIAQGQPFHWNLHNNSGNWTNAYIGETIAMQGDWRTGKFINTATSTASTEAVRFTIQELGPVNVEGQIKSIYHNNLNSLSGYTRVDLGDMLLFASPYNENNVILQGNKKAGAEFSLSSASAGVPTKVNDIPSIIPEVANHTGIFRYGGKIYMTSPTFSGNNNNGVMLVDITNGLASGTNVSLSTSDMSSSATTNVATVGTGVVTFSGDDFVEARLAILAVRNGSVTKFITPSIIESGDDDQAEIISALGDTDFGQVKVGESASRSFKVEGVNLTSTVTATVSGAGFSVNMDYDTNDNTGTVTVTFAPTETGTSTGLVTLSSPGADNVTAMLKGTGISAVTGSTNGIESLTEMWNFSAQKGNTDGSFVSLTNPETRSIAIQDENLYVLNYTYPNTADMYISVIDTHTGRDTGKRMNLDGIGGGLYTLSHLETLGTDLYASMCATAPTAVKVYRWKNCAGKPEVALEYDFSSVMPSSTRLGEMLSVYGDEQNGKLIMTANPSDANTTLFVFDMVNGVVNPNPQIIVCKKTLDGATSTSGVEYLGDGTYMVMTKDQFPTRIDSDGNIIESISGVNMTSKYGTAGKTFMFGDRQYFAATSYMGSGYNNGVLDILDVTDGWQKAELKYVQPENGFGGSTNSTAVTDVEYEILDDGHTINLYVCVPRQGVAMYQYSNVEKVEPENPEEPDISPDFSDRHYHAYNLKRTEEKETATITFHSTGAAYKAFIKLTPTTSTFDARGAAEPYIIEVNDVVKGENTVELKKCDLPYANLTWEVEILNHPVAEAKKLKSIAPATLDSRGGIGVITDVSHPLYGYTITSNGWAQGFKIFNPEHELVGSYDADYFDGTKGGHGTRPNWTAGNRSSVFRLAIRDNIVYAIDYADAGAGIWLFNPEHPEYGTGNIFAAGGATWTSGGCWTLNGTPLGGGGSGLCFTGSGANTKLWSFQEDYPSGNSSTDILCSWNIGTANAITSEPTSYSTITSGMFANKNVNLVPDGDKGMFVAQTRGNGNNSTGCPGFVYIDLQGKILYNSGNDNDIIPSCGGGIALSADRSLLAVSGGKLNIRVFDVAWGADGTPKLTFKYEIANSAGDNDEVSQMAFDVAGNLVAYTRGATATTNGFSLYSIPNETGMRVSTPALATASDDNIIHATTTGVGDVSMDAEDVEAVYYNLNGVRMPDGDKLPAGVYIKVEGSKTTKVVIR